MRNAITFSLPTVLDMLLAALRKKMVADLIYRKAPLELNKSDYEHLFINLKQFCQKINFSNLVEQLDQKHDTYQQGNRAFHALLEYLNNG